MTTYKTPAPVLWGIIIFVIWITVSFCAKAVEIHSLKEETAVLKGEKIALSREQEILKTRLASYNNDEAIKVYARRNLNMVLPGEQKVVTATVSEEILPKGKVTAEICD